MKKLRPKERGTEEIGEFSCGPRAGVQILDVFSHIKCIVSGLPGFGSGSLVWWLVGS